MSRKCLILLLSLIAMHGVFANTSPSKPFDKHDSLAVKPLLKELLMQNQQTLNHLMTEVQALQKSRQQDVITTPKKAEKMPSPLDREAMNSPIFLPGGAPIPEGYNGGGANQQKQQQASTQNNKNKSADDATQTKNQNNDSTSGSLSNYNNPYSNNYNNYSGGSYFPNTSTKFQATFSSVNSSYSYGIAKENNTFVDPFANISDSDKISLKITGNSSGSNSTYNSIKFCNANFTTCNSVLSMSGNTRNLTSNQLVGGSSSYSLTSLSFNGTSANYQVARLYAQITNSSSITTNISFSFPVSNCTVADSGDLSCSLGTSGVVVPVASN
ncbi:hypothetical protein [Cysteiniphilum halobium]|uniref:hypothetical protein n=1 Tax=Cysteiniphilum halobium TaxID=2219059 RepID=UPI0013C2E0C4|nr:hypothetical protein [Cysteiniphilum halobium]